MKKQSEFLKKVLKIIPLGTQTFSRSKIFFDEKFSPLFNIKGKNQYLYDLNNIKYLDLISSLGAVSIGYSNNLINKEIIKTLKNGVTYSLAHPLEFEVSKLLVKHIPCAEMVRFGKNGTDATSAAIRLSRFITSRNKIAVCGYHGWQDWYISSTTMNQGIPQYISKDIHAFEYNNLENLKKILNKGKFAAIIMEPLSYTLPKNNFLKKVKVLAKEHGALLIFDEICTGFRVSLGGAQKLYKVIPDLATFGKGMANGFPLSALVGKKKYMNQISKVFFSGTFGGETLSLSACKQTIKFLIINNTINKNILKGEKIKAILNAHLKKNNLENVLEFDGHPTWLFLKIKSSPKMKSSLIRAYIMQEMSENNILFLGSINLQHSHTMKNINYIIKIFKKIFDKIQMNKENLKKITYYKIAKPLFKVRN